MFNVWYVVWTASLIGGRTGIRGFEGSRFRGMRYRKDVDVIDSKFSLDTGKRRRMKGNAIPFLSEVVAFRESEKAD